MLIEPAYKFLFAPSKRPSRGTKLPGPGPGHVSGALLARHYAGRHFGIKFCRCRSLVLGMSILRPTGMRRIASLPPRWHLLPPRPVEPCLAQGTKGEGLLVCVYFSRMYALLNAVHSGSWESTSMNATDPIWNCAAASWSPGKSRPMLRIRSGTVLLLFQLPDGSRSMLRIRSGTALLLSQLPERYYRCCHPVW